MKKIIFVCTGNTCRSVIAEMLFKKMISDKISSYPDTSGQLKGIFVSSAGIAPVPGMGSAPGTVRVLAQEGIDASKHKAKKLSAGDVKAASIVLVMEKRQEAEAARIAGCCDEKIFALNSFSLKDDSDIADPFGHSVEIYIECKNQIQKALEGLFDKILKGEI